ncbi:MAG: flagellar basal-body rod protein FlgF [Candidatus Eisenbacteria bacterium]
MSNGIYLAGAAMVSRQYPQEALTNNLANLNTPGFKAGRVFAKVLEEVEGGADTVRRAASNQTLYIDFSQGEFQSTGRSLDLAIDGDGFFTVETPSGPLYTRSGNFSMDGEGRLVTGQGYGVLGEQGPVELPPGGNLEVDETGGLFVDGRRVGGLQIVHFTELQGLERKENGLFGPRRGADLRPAEGEYRVLQGSLESSNVNPSSEMMQMMILLREYESSQRAVQSQSQALGRVVNELIQG